MRSNYRGKRKRRMTKEEYSKLSVIASALIANSMFKGIMNDIRERVEDNARSISATAGIQEERTRDGEKNS